MKKIEINKIYNQNCIEGMKLIPKNKIDLVITDPPFAINFKAKKANYNRTASRVLSGYNEIKPEDYYDFTHSWMSQVFRILKDSGSMYVFSGWNNLKDILRALDDVGFVTINHIIWKYQFIELKVNDFKEFGITNKNDLEKIKQYQIKLKKKILSDLENFNNTADKIINELHHISINYDSTNNESKNYSGFTT